MFCTDDWCLNADEGRVIGVRYITEDLIRRVAKQDDLSSIQTINLCGSKCDKKIKVR